MIDLKNKSFLKLLDFSPEEISYLLDLSAQLKQQKLLLRRLQKKKLSFMMLQEFPAASLMIDSDHRR